MDEQPSAQKLYQVKPWGRAVKEARAGQLFASEKERARVFGQLRLLRHWPPPLEAKTDEVVSFLMETIECSGVKFYEIKFTKCGWLSHNQNLRVFGYIEEANRIVWIVYGFWKTENGPISECTKRTVGRRVNDLRAWLQDGGRK